MRQTWAEVEGSQYYCAPRLGVSGSTGLGSLPTAPNPASTTPAPTPPAKRSGKANEPVGRDEVSAFWYYGACRKDVLTEA